MMEDVHSQVAGGSPGWQVTGRALKGKPEIG
jgi:hypothetical protein